MCAVGTETQAQIRLLPFRQVYASLIAGWVKTLQELHWLSPSTPPPLTADKIGAWQRPQGRSFVCARGPDSTPLGYAELNPMRHRADQLWLGHCIVHPAHRGQGIGRAFVRALLSEAFDGMFARRISLIVFPKNVMAVRCYLAAGFRVVGEEEHRFAGLGSKCRFLRLETRHCPLDRGSASD